MIKIKRVYDSPASNDGRRFLVDRLWPRGIKREAMRLAGWLKETAPSHALRTWYGHDPAKWEEFCRRYFAELDANPSAWTPLLQAARSGDITLLYSSRETRISNAAALKRYLDPKI